ncbi:MAG: DNA cytosine methyltransferase [Chlamydiia bacterium]
MFTPRQVARMQSFPESFQPTSINSTNYRVLGNVVALVVIWHVMRSIVKALRIQVVMARLSWQKSKRVNRERPLMR